MNFPKRIKQHKAESDSYAILLYKLKDIGIFRNLTENDYGIDFEIELVNDEKLTGQYLKAQVKSSEKLSIRKKDKVPRVSGIKQSTLNYWAELSYKTNVIVYAVDLKTENIYLTKPIFWQATELIDNTNRSKSISFLPVDQYHKEITSAFTCAFGMAPNISETIHFHQAAIRSLKEFIEFYTDIFHYDAHMPICNPELFRSFLNICSVLLHFSSYDKEGLSEEEKERLISYEYWALKGDLSFEEIPNYISQKPMKILMPAFLDALSKYNNLVLKGKYYWSYKNYNYLRLVYENQLPNSKLSHDDILEMGYEIDRYDSQKPRDFYKYLMDIRQTK